MESNRDLFFPNHSQDVIDAYCEEHYGQFVESHLRVLPGAAESLAAVRAALGGDVRRMALCTNCPLAITRQIIAHCPMLSEYFPESRLVCAGTSQLVDGPALSAEEGQLRALELSPAERDAALGGSVFTTEGRGISYTLKAKPSADIIYAAAHRLGLRARDCLFVGDSKYDLMSALKAGCFALGIGQQQHHLLELPAQHRTDLLLSVCLHSHAWPPVVSSLYVCALLMHQQARRARADTCTSTTSRNWPIR